jgi:hypothetical protein
MIAIEKSNATKVPVIVFSKKLEQLNPHCSAKISFVKQL